MCAVLIAARTRVRTLHPRTIVGLLLIRTAAAVVHLLRAHTLPRGVTVHQLIRSAALRDDGSGPPPQPVAAAPKGCSCRSLADRGFISPLPPAFLLALQQVRVHSVFTCLLLCCFFFACMYV